MLEMNPCTATLYALRGSTAKPQTLRANSTRFTRLGLHGGIRPLLVQFRSQSSRASKASPQQIDFAASLFRAHQCSKGISMPLFEMSSNIQDSSPRKRSHDDFVEENHAKMTAHNTTTLSDAQSMAGSRE